MNYILCGFGQSPVAATEPLGNRAAEADMDVTEREFNSVCGAIHLGCAHSQVNNAPKSEDWRLVLDQTGRLDAVPIALFSVSGNSLAV